MKTTLITICKILLVLTGFFYSNGFEMIVIMSLVYFFFAIPVMELLNRLTTKYLNV